MSQKQNQKIVFLLLPYLVHFRDAVINLIPNTIATPTQTTIPTLIITSPIGFNCSANLSPIAFASIPPSVFLPASLNFFTESNTFCKLKLEFVDVDDIQIAGQDNQPTVNENNRDENDGKERAIN